MGSSEWVEEFGVASAVLPSKSMAHHLGDISTCVLSLVNVVFRLESLSKW